MSIDNVEEDDVNNPSHYKKGSIEVITFIEDQDLPFHAANTIKYICRYRYKGTPIKDLQKAKWYIDRLIKFEENKIKV